MQKRMKCKTCGTWLVLCNVQGRVFWKHAFPLAKNACDRIKAREAAKFDKQGGS